MNETGHEKSPTDTALTQLDSRIEGLENELGGLFGRLDRTCKPSVPVPATQGQPVQSIGESELVGCLVRFRDRIERLQDTTNDCLQRLEL